MNDRQPSIGTQRVRVGRALPLTVAALGLGALALPATTFAQQGAQQQLASLNGEIEATELRAGPNSTELIEPLTALAEHYQRSGQPVLAAAALQQAINVVRYNYGLHSLEQAPLIRQLIANAESVGDRRSAWDLEQGLLALAGRYPDDPRSARILRDTADRRMELLARYNAGEKPPEIGYGCYYTEPHDVPMAFIGLPTPGCSAGSSTFVRQNLVKEAQAYYGRAADILLDSERASDELPPLLMQLVESGYRYGNPSLGRRSLNSLLAYQTSNQETLPTRVDTLVQIADWDLIYSVGRDEEEAALAEYADAYRLLEEQGVAKDQIDRTFAPQTPVVLPAFLPNPLVNEPVRESAGHIDIAFEVDKYGRSRHVRIREASDGLTHADERHAVQLVLRSRFRPMFADARSARATTFVVRYYLERPQ